MHNKLFIADNRFSVSGGRNMADEYFMRSARANFIDMDVISTGPVVDKLAAVFDRYWNSDYAYPVQSVVPLRIDAAAAEWKVPASECTAADSVVTHTPSGRKIGYGHLAAAEFQKVQEEQRRNRHRGGGGGHPGVEECGEPGHGTSNSKFE